MVKKYENISIHFYTTYNQKKKKSKYFKDIKISIKNILKQITKKKKKIQKNIIKTMNKKKDPLVF